MFKKARTAITFFCFLMLLFSTVTMASDDTKPYLSYHSSLSPKFSVDNYKTCNLLLKSCPTEGMFRKKSCVGAVLRNNKVCTQFKKLSEILDTQPTLLNIKNIGNLTIVNSPTIADGQDHYYIMANGVLINMNIDPRILSRSLRARYNKKTWITVNWGKPIYKVTSNNTKTVTVTVRVSDTCLACSIIGFAKIQFNFTKTNRLINVELITFSKNSALNHHHNPSSPQAPTHASP